MIKKLLDLRILGFIFTIASTAFIITLSIPFFTEARLQPFLYDSGVDSMGSLVCAALFYGCMRQKGEGTKNFRLLILLVSACFALNEVLFYTSLKPELRTVCFILCLVTKLLDIVVVTLFCRYIRVTLGFEGKLAKWAGRIIPVLMILQIMVLISDIFYPVTFFVDANGVYQMTPLTWVGDIYLVAVSAITIIQIIMCRSSHRQKVAAMTFMLFPVVEYVLIGHFGNSGQYGTILMSLIVMYCVIFNEKSTKLAATQTELNMATDIQASMLPSTFPAFPERSEFDLHASMDPAKEVGGDFYDMFMIDEDHLAMVIADVSGKGVPAALFMMSSKIMINDHALMGGSPAEILGRVNKQVFATNDANMFVTVWLGILEISTGKLTSASAGHEYPMINTNGKYELLKDKHGLAVGAMGMSKYKNTEITLKKGDSIFVYTDGVAEANNASGELFGTNRTLEALNAIPEGVPQKDVLAGVRAAVDAFVKEAPQFDDLTMLGLKYYGPDNHAG